MKYMSLEGYEFSIKEVDSIELAGDAKITASTSLLSGRFFYVVHLRDGSSLRTTTSTGRLVEKEMENRKG